METRHSRYLLGIGIVVATLLLVVAWPALLRSAAQAAPEVTTGQTLPEPGPVHAPADNWQMPLLFIQNVGQFDPQVRYLLRQGSRLLWLTEDGLWLSSLDEKALQASLEQWRQTGRAAAVIPGVQLRLKFAGANFRPAIEPFNRLPARTSYFLGDDPAAWRNNVPVWGGVRYRDLYPGVDLVLSSGPATVPWHLEVETGADLSVVQLQIDGADALEVLEDALRMDTAAGQVSAPLMPVTFKGDILPDLGRAAGLVPVVSQRAPQRFILSAPLRFDQGSQLSTPRTPADVTDLAYSTYLGGSGNADYGEDVAVDDAGMAYVAGHTQSADFPTTAGAYSTTLQARDAFVSKIDPAGNGTADLIYSTFIGGGSLDRGLGIAVANGQAYLVGVTASRSFPTTSGAFKETCGTDALCDGFDDAFLTVLNSTGSDLVYSTFLGGKHQDTANAIAISGGELYIAGNTRSSDFPTSSGAFDDECGSDGKCDPTGNDPGQDGFFVKMVAAGNGQNDLLYGTFLGGWAEDQADGIAASGGDALIIGDTASPDFPVSPGGPGYSGAKDAYVLRITPDGSGSGDRVFGRFLGGTENETGEGIDAIGGTAVAVGLTRSTDFPVTAGSEAFHGGYSDAFVVWLDGAGDITYAAFLGGSSLETAGAVTLDGRGGAIIAGYTASTDFPTERPYDDSLNGGYDLFVARMDLGSTRRSDFLTYSSFLGGSANDEQYGLDLSQDGYAYLAGRTFSTDYPTTPGAFSSAISGTVDVIFSKILAAPPPGIDIEKSTNGFDADEPPGPYVTVGSQINWQYVITNTGGVSLTNVQVNDDRLGPVCSLASMAPDDTLVCNKTGTAVPDQYFNAATVTANAPPELGLDPVTDIDLSYYFGAVPELDLEKYTNGHNADQGPGPFIRVGDPLTWTFVVTNTGNVRLTGIVVTDSVEGPASCDYDFLERNQKATCIITATTGAIAGSYTNTGFARATPPGGLADVTDQDDSHYFGADPSVSMLKLTNDQIAHDMPGPYVLANDPVTWTYIITNTGNVALTVAAVVDDRGVAVTCPNPDVAVASWTACAGSDLAIAGQYTNTAEVQASAPAGDDVTAVDSSHYYGVDPAVLIKKLTNGQDANQAPGPFIPEGDPVSWTYIVTNTGNITLTKITVTDNHDISVSCEPAPVSRGQAKICAGSGIAISGQYSNTGMVLATPLFGPDVTWSDDSYYYGSSPDITVVKRTNGISAEIEPGPYIKVGDPVTWTYEIINSGNITLTGIAVTDGKLGPISCPSDVLGQGQSTSCQASGVASAGQYSNTVTAVGMPPVGQNVSGEGVSYYYGVDAEISLKKLTNGQPGANPPGPYVIVGDLVNWTFIVSNTGNSTLTDIVLNDDQLGAVTCPSTALESGQHMSCQVNDTATAGQHTNTATVEGRPPVGPSVSDQDSSHYYGVDPGVATKKLTNGQEASRAPGPYVLEGNPVSWTYIVTNTGNITLTTVTVTDSRGEEVTCEQNSLGLDAAMTCVASGIAGSGQYSNTAQVTAGPLFGPQVIASDTSFYFGMSPELKLTKRTNSQIARSAPGPYILVNQPVTWTYDITNSGNITLSAIVLVDDQLGPIICPKDILSAGESMACQESGLATAGQYTNTATVSGAPASNAPAAGAPTRPLFSALSRAAPITRLVGEFAFPFDLATAGQDRACLLPTFGLAAQASNTTIDRGVQVAGGQVTATDTSHYFGADPVIAIRKTTNGLLAGQPPGPIVDFNAGDTVTWTLVVSNTGNVPLEAVLVADDHGTPGDPDDDFHCDFGAMAIGGPAQSCTFSAASGAGHYSNIATVSATPPGGLNDIANQVVSHYFGSDPSVLLTKYTNGVDVETPPGPALIVDRPVYWTYEVRNTGNYTLTQLLVLDQEGPVVDPGSAVTVCEIDALGPGQSRMCKLEGIVITGQYTNTAVVTGLPPIGAMVSDQDSSHYYGARGLFIPLIKKN